MPEITRLSASCGLPNQVHISSTHNNCKYILCLELQGRSSGYFLHIDFKPVFRPKCLTKPAHACGILVIHLHYDRALLLRTNPGLHQGRQTCVRNICAYARRNWGLSFPLRFSLCFEFAATLRLGPVDNTISQRIKFRSLGILFMKISCPSIAMEESHIKEVTFHARLATLNSKSQWIHLLVSAGNLQDVAKETLRRHCFKWVRQWKSWSEVTKSNLASSASPDCLPPIL